MTPEQLSLERRAYVEQFLECVAPGDAANHCFQAFPDTDKSAPASPVLHGTFAQHQPALEAYSAKGYGVFFCVNATNGHGRRLTDIVRVRALWLDIDAAGRDTGPIEAALTPHCVVESSPGKHHLYWRVSNCPLDAFDGVLDALTTKWQGDHGAKGINRVLRLPGFPHLKNPAAPFVTRFVRWQP